MAYSYNQVVLVGRLGSDPDARFGGECRDGLAHATLRVATDCPERREPLRGSADGRARPDWHQVRCRGQVAEFAARYLRKGRLVLVTGHLHYDEFEGKDGRLQRVPEIHASEIVPLDRPPQASPLGASSVGSATASPPEEVGARAAAAAAAAARTA